MHHAMGVLAVVAYSISALPVFVWLAFWSWGFAKQRHEAAMFEQSTDTACSALLIALIIPLIWTIGAVGASMLARRARPWRIWAWCFVAIPAVAGIDLTVRLLGYTVAYWQATG
jgi:hypothetical protein